MMDKYKYSTSVTGLMRIYYGRFLDSRPDGWFCISDKKFYLKITWNPALMFSVFELFRGNLWRINMHVDTEQG